MKLVIVLFPLFIPKVYAFNYEKCTGTSWSGSGVDLTSSSIQFTSSWGQCAAIGVVEQKKEFLAINYEKLKIDASRGAGEYINSYGILSECSLAGSIELGVQMQKNIQLVFPEIKKQFEKTYKTIETIMNQNPVLKRECKIIEDVVS